MVDLQKLRATIEKAPTTGPAVIVHRRWLEEVEKDLAELRALRAAGKAN